jgi:flavin-binding protein dodecin
LRSSRGVDGIISDAGRVGGSQPSGVSRVGLRTKLEGGMTMPDHVYRIIQVAGSSEKSIGDAIQNAVGRASSTLRQVGWFEVVETRGHVEDGRVAHYQVTLKVGFTLDDD